ncbi:hypothetical protein [Actibacterium pelagium]|uniref:Uncharacterized protein n=1 Tax=Actibacterium pelagium TaxID=2029103 RepID=A0A917EME4_9RHOB|nr:hypothetical protein [Actibacterium pelagium]GGE56797.1 hypothetical protein GCM10011517_25720 [Actibacterium pelagium]
MDTLRYKQWLETVCGNRDDFFDNMESRQEERVAFLDKQVSDLLKPQSMDATRNLLMSIKMKTEDGTINVLESTTKSTHKIKREGRSLRIIKTTKPKTNVPDTEWDAVDDRAGQLTGAEIDGKKVDFTSKEGTELIRKMEKAMQPYLDLSRDMARRGMFTDREIEAEVWAPLVRQGVLPTNLVPDEYSETMRATQEGAEVYRRLMDREDGTSMGSDPVGIGIKVAKHVVNAIKVTGDGIMRNLQEPGLADIMEASRQDFAEFIHAREYKMDVSPEGVEKLSALRKIEGNGEPLPEDADADKIWADHKEELKAAGIEDKEELEAVMENDRRTNDVETMMTAYGEEGDTTPTQVMMGEYEEYDGDKDFNEWLDDEIKDGGGIDQKVEENDQEILKLDAQVQSGDLSPEEAAKARAQIADLEEQNAALKETKTFLSENEGQVKGMKMMNSFGKHLQYKAIQNVAGTVMTTAVETAEKIHQKQQKREVALGVANGIADVLGEAVQSLGVSDGELEVTSAEDRLSQGHLDEAHDAKFYTAAAKGAMASLVSLGTAVAEGGKGRPMRDHFLDFASSLINCGADVVSGLGTNDGSMPTTKEDNTDTRAEYSSYALIPKSSAILVAAAGKLQDLWVAGKKKEFMAEVGTILAGGVSAGVTGVIGDATRKNVALEDIGEGWDNEQNGDPFVSPFIEIEGAGGQTSFGMNSDMATVADQRAALEDTLDLFQGLHGDLSGSSDKTPPDLKILRSGVDSAIKALSEVTPEKDEKDDGKDAARKLLSELRDLDVARKKPEDIHRMLDDARSHIDTAISEVRDSAKRKDQAILSKMGPNVDREKMGSDLSDLQDMLDNLSGDDAADPDEIERKIIEIQKEMMKDPRILLEMDAELAEENNRIEELKRKADMTRLDSLGKDENPGEARQEALDAIAQLTRQLKADELKLKMADKGTKGALGIALASVPGAALAMKVRNLGFQIAAAEKRRRDLSIWVKQMEAMAGNYSVYENVAAGEKATLEKLYATDIVDAVAETMGIVAETMRLIDHTHATAGAMTSLEKSVKAVNSAAKDYLQQANIKEGWAAYLEAIDNPSNRRQAREAIRKNTTFAKCVLAYGACIDGDQQAISAVQACGLSAEVLMDDTDNCDAAVDYLRARLSDTEYEIIADQKSGDWLPCEAKPRLPNWLKIKSEACGLRPAMSDASFNSSDVDSAMYKYEEALAAYTASQRELKAENAAKAQGDGSGQRNNDKKSVKRTQFETDQAAFIKAQTTLNDALKKWTPLSENGRPHKRMITARNEVVAALAKEG